MISIPSTIVVVRHLVWAEKSDQTKPWSVETQDHASVIVNSAFLDVKLVTRTSAAAVA